MQIKGRGVRTMIRIGISTRTDFSVKTFDKQGGLESESFARNHSRRDEQHTIVCSTMVCYCSSSGSLRVDCFSAPPL